ncbi:MAG: dihydrodipicolinate synthase family protein [Candidatus Thorarchaeota archaeon]
MSLKVVRSALRGVAVTTATPFTADLRDIDTDSIVTNVEFLQDGGIRLIIPCGNTGEYYSLSESEWLRVVETTIEAAASETVVMAGVGGAVSTLRWQVKQAENAGASAVMVLYPQHVFRSESGIIEYYREALAAADEIAVVLYKKGPLLTDDVISKMSDDERVVGVKYAYGRIVDFARSVQRLGHTVVWTCGTAERFAPFFWLAGAEGFTSGLANFAPRVSLTMLEALRAGDWTRAMKIQEMITPLEFLRERHGRANNVSVVKAAMDCSGLIGGRCRPPIHELSDAERKDVAEIVGTWDI